MPNHSTSRSGTCVPGSVLFLTCSLLILAFWLKCPPCWTNKGFLILTSDSNYFISAPADVYSSREILQSTKDLCLVSSTVCMLLCHDWDYASGEGHSLMIDA